MTTLLELPEEVVDYVFSKMEYLTSKDVIQLSLVSKQFQSLCIRHPALIFDDLGPHSDLQLNHMISALERYKNDDIPLEKFTVGLHRHSAPRRLKKAHYHFIRLAAFQKGLKFLSLSMRCSVPRPVFEVDSLVELRLERCKMRLKERIAWRNLRRLTLDDVDIGEGVFANILRSCPLIETLKIDGHCQGDIQYEHFSASTNLGKSVCQNLKDLTMLAYRVIERTQSDLILNFSRLEKLEFSNRYCESISISSPSLKQIHYYYYVNRDIRPIHQIHFNAPNMALFEFAYFWNNNAFDFPELSFTGNPSGWISHIKFRIFKQICSSWAVKLKEMLEKFSAALNKSEICSVTLELNDTIVPDDEFINIFPGREIDIAMVRIISTGMSYSLSSASAILNGIFLICMPKKVEFWRSYNSEIPQCIEQHHVNFSTSGHEEIIEVLKDCENKDKFFVSFSRLPL